MFKRIFRISFFSILFLSKVAFAYTVKDTTINISTDAVIKSASSTSNFGTSDYITAASTPGLKVSSIARSLIRVDVSNIPDNAIILNAEITLHGYLHQGSFLNSLTQRVTESWSENLVTWDNQPTITTEGQVTMPSPGGSDDDCVINITEFVKGWHTGLFENYGILFRLMFEYPTNELNYYSSDYSSFSERPSVTIKYVVPDFINQFPTEDMIVAYLYPDSVFSPETPFGDLLAWTQSGHVNKRRVLMKFDMDTIPERSMLVSSKLHMFWNGFSWAIHAGDNKSHIYPIDMPWSQDTLTWNNQPGYLPNPNGIIPATTSSTQTDFEFDIFEIVNSWYSGENENNGILMRLDTESIYRKICFASKEHSDPSTHPFLTLGYIPPLSVSYDYNLPVNDGLTSLETQPYGGVPPYSFQWSHMSASTTDTLLDIYPGTYELTVSDFFDSTFVKEINVYQKVTWEVLDSMQLSNGVLSPVITTNNWNARALAKNSIEINDRGLIMHVLDASAFSASGKYIVGFQESKTLPDYFAVDHGFLVNSTNVQVIENGDLYSSFSYNQNDTVFIEKKDGNIRYYKNDSLVYTSLCDEQAKLYMSAISNSPGCNIDNVYTTGRYDMLQSIRYFANNYLNGKFRITFYSPAGMSFLWDDNSTDNFCDINDGIRDLQLSDAQGRTIDYSLTWGNVLFQSGAVHYINDSTFNLSESDVILSQNNINTNLSLLSYPVLSYDKPDVGEYKYLGICSGEVPGNYVAGFKFGNGSVFTVHNSSETYVSTYNSASFVQLQCVDDSVKLYLNSNLLATYALTPEQEYFYGVSATDPVRYTDLFTTNYSETIDINFSLIPENSDDYQLDVLTVGGVHPFSYQWENNNTGNPRHSLRQGYYTLTVSDAVGNSGESDYFICDTVQMYDIENTNIADNTITAGGNTADWACKAISYNTLSRGESGLVRWVISKKYKEMSPDYEAFLGLCQSNLGSYADLSHSFYLDHQQVCIYENGEFKKQLGEISFDDIYEIKVSGNSVQYLKNDTICLTSPLDNSSALCFGTSIKTTGQYIEDVFVSFSDRKLPFVYLRPFAMNSGRLNVQAYTGNDTTSAKILWNNGVNVVSNDLFSHKVYSYKLRDSLNRQEDCKTIINEVDWGISNYITSNDSLMTASADNWNAFAMSEVSMGNDETGFIAYNISVSDYANNNASARIFGITDDQNTSQGTIKHAIVLQNHNFFVSESGVKISSEQTYAPGDLLSIQKVNDTVYYLKNGNAVLISVADINTLFPVCRMERAGDSFGPFLTDIRNPLKISVSGVSEDAISFQIAGGTPPYALYYDGEPVSSSVMSYKDDKEHVFSVIDKMNDTTGYEFSPFYTPFWHSTLDMVKTDSLFIRVDDNYSSGISYTYNLLPESRDGSIIKSAADLGRDDISFGLTDPDDSDAIPDYTLRYTEGIVRLYENGVRRKTVSCPDLDNESYLSIRKSGQDLLFALNDSVLFSLERTVSSDLIAFVEVYTVGDTAIVPYCTFKPTPITCEIGISDPGIAGDISIKKIMNGVPPYHIEWENGDTVSEQRNVSPGVYPFSITDASGTVLDTIAYFLNISDFDPSGDCYIEKNKAVLKKGSFSVEDYAISRSFVPSNASAVFVMEETDPDYYMNNKIFGFSDKAKDPEIYDYDFAVQDDRGNLSLIINGQRIATNTAIVEKDVVKLYAWENRFILTLNDSLIYRHERNPEKEMYFMTHLFEDFGILSPVYSSASNPAQTAKHATPDYTGKKIVLAPEQSNIINSDRKYQVLKATDELVWSFDRDVVRRSLLKYNTDLIPRDMQIASARLILSPKGTSFGTNKSQVLPCSEAWHPDSVCWDNLPGYDTNYKVEIPATDSAGELYAVDLTHMVKSWYAGDLQNNGFYCMLEKENVDAGMFFTGGDSVSYENQPLLEIYFYEPLALTTSTSKIEDTYVASTKPNAPHGYLEELEARGSDVSRIFIKLPVEDIPYNASVESATLVLKDMGSITPNASTAYLVSGEWSEDSLMWDNMPNYYDKYSTQVFSDISARDSLVIDLTRFIPLWQSGIIDNNGLMIRLNDESGGRLLFLGSSENRDSTLRPYMSVKYSVEPLDLYVEDKTPGDDTLASVRMIATGGVPPYKMTVNSVDVGVDAGFENEEFSNKNIRITDSWGNVLSRNINLQQHQNTDLPSSAENTGWNWYQSSTYNQDYVDGNLVESKVGESRVFIDAYGRSHQAQSKSFESGNILCQQVVYDEYGRRAIQSLPAPVDDDKFEYRNNFMTSSGDAFNKYTPGKNAAERKVDRNSILGHYYSNSNTDEAYVPETDYPYYQVEYNKIMQSVPEKTSMAGDNLYLGSNHESKSYPMFIRSNELFHITGAQSFLINEDHHIFEDEIDVETPINFLYEKGMMKILSEDPDGKQFVSYSIGGKPVARAKVAQDEKAGNYKREVYSRMAPFQSFIDIHVSEGVVDEGINIQANYETDINIYSVSTGESILEIPNINTWFYDINDLETEEVSINGQDYELSIEQSSIPANFIDIDQYSTEDYYSVHITGLPEGVYRIYRSDPSNLSQIINIGYYIDYYNYSLSYYDETGKLSKTIYPEGVQQLPEEILPSISVSQASSVIRTVEVGANPGEGDPIPFVPHFTSANQVDGIYRNIITIPVEQEENSVDCGKISVRMFRTTRIVVADELPEYFAPVAETSNGLVVRNVAMAGTVNASKAVENVSPYVYGGLFLINDTAFMPVIDINGTIFSIDSTQQIATWHGDSELIEGVKQIDTERPLVKAGRETRIGDLDPVQLSDITYNEHLQLTRSNSYKYLEEGTSLNKSLVIGNEGSDNVVHPSIPTLNNITLDFEVYGITQSEPGVTGRHLIEENYEYKMLIRGDNTLTSEGIVFDETSPDIYHWGELEIPADVFENITEIQLELKEIHCNQSEEAPYGLSEDLYNTSYYAGNYSTGDLNTTYDDFTADNDYGYYYFSGLDNYEVNVKLETTRLQNAPEHTMYDSYSYNNWGQLLSNTTVDVGVTSYLYRKDGRIRFTKNEKQANENTFSYINYDDLGRIMETGEYAEDENYNFSTLESILEDVVLLNDFGSEALPDASCRDQIFFRYDTGDKDLTFENKTGLSANNYKFEFTEGRLTKTWTDDALKWFSYDDFGRLSWMVIHYEGMGRTTLEGTKTYHMEYDLLGNLKRMTYQKNNESERFDYVYSYNADMMLSSVSIQTNYNAGTPGLVQEIASYEYYPDGKLKRTVVEEGLQGIDYVYTINGWLKSINNPNLGLEYGGKLTDPGQDSFTTNGVAPDVFGLSLDYFDGDYKRGANTTGTGATYINSGEGTNYYSGQIRSQRWNTSDGPQNNELANDRTHWMFRYDYDEFNRFVGAGFGQYTANMQTNGTNGQSPHNLTDDVLSQITVIQAPQPYSNGEVLSGVITQIADAGKELNYFSDHSAQSGNSVTHFENSENFAYFNANAAIVQSMIETGQNMEMPQSQASYTYGFAPDTDERYRVYGIEYSANGNILNLKRNGGQSGSNACMDDLSYHYLNNSNQLNYVSDAVPAVRYADDIDSQASGNFGYDLIGMMVEDAADGLRHVKDSRGKTTEIRDAQTNAALTVYTYDESGYCISMYDCNLKHTTWFVRGPGGEIISVYTEAEGSATEQEEQYLYGIGRLGKASTDQNHADIVLLQYEYQDHLGNVRAVFQRNTGDAEVIAVNDYYPFGMKMPDRCMSTGDYGHAYQGVFAQEDAQYSQYNRFLLRTYDNRLGRFLSPDPYGQYYSAYAGMGNNPVNTIDPSGGAVVNYTFTSKTFIYEDNDWVDLLEWYIPWTDPISSNGGSGAPSSSAPADINFPGGGNLNGSGSGLSGSSVSPDEEEHKVVPLGVPDEYETEWDERSKDDPPSTDSDPQTTEIEKEKGTPGKIMLSGLTISAVLLADDATVVGVVDDVAIPFVIIGSAVAAGTIWVVDYFAEEHVKNKQKKNWDKHTKKRSGRKNTKNRKNPKWKENPNKKN